MADDGQRGELVRECGTRALMMDNGVSQSEGVYKMADDGQRGELVRGCGTRGLMMDNGVSQLEVVS